MIRQEEGSSSSRATAAGSPTVQNVKPAEQLFYDTAVIPECGIEEEVLLFFEPRSKKSREVTCMEAS